MKDELLSITAKIRCDWGGGNISTFDLVKLNSIVLRLLSDSFIFSADWTASSI